MKKKTHQFISFNDLVKHDNNFDKLRIIKETFIYFKR